MLSPEGQALLPAYGLYPLPEPMQISVRGALNAIGLDPGQATWQFETAGADDNTGGGRSVGWLCLLYVRMHCDV